MEIINFSSDIKVFGLRVATFPQGIGEAFDTLISKTGDCAGDRDYYGIAKQDTNGQMVYYATAAEKHLMKRRNLVTIPSLLRKVITGRKQ